MSLDSLLDRLSVTPLPTGPDSGNALKPASNGDCYPCNPVTPPNPVRLAEVREQLTAYLVALANDLAVRPTAILDMLSDDDVADWARGEMSREFFIATANSLQERDALARGEVPQHYTHVAHCDGCGPVWLWTPGRIAGCPWCLVRRDGRPIPQPKIDSGEPQ